MIDQKALLADLQREVRTLQLDLRPTGEESPELYQEWEDAKAAGRTAADFQTWLTDRVTQVAVAWVLATVFVRFAEDNHLIEDPYLAGPGDERTAQARERQEEYLHAHPEQTDRDWIKAAFAAMGKSPVARALFAEHNPMHSIPPTNDAAKALIAFWRKTNANGAIVHDFTDKTWDTRFLGDLYQNLSEETRKTYALLQTPEFVEEFILKYTLDPAIEEFGLEPDPPYDHPNLPRQIRVIDPACGSGHFLIGAFRRLLSAWEAHSPGTDKWQLIANAMSSVHGVDKNPYAVAIARFRLLIEAMRAGSVTSLTEKVDFPLNLGVGDSLIHGDYTLGEQTEFEIDGRRAPYTYRVEDIDDYVKSVSILAYRSYHAVFANPPYITVKDKAESELYRERYKSCYREYSLSIPFAERIFKLAIVGTVERKGAGYTGQITANSFMKREFGKRLIEQYFADMVDVTHIIDTSGAYIPGHGTPTVILFGRRRFPRRGSTIRAVLGVRGEPSEPAVAAQGFVWQAILAQTDKPGSESEWVSVSDEARSKFERHPWSLGGGGAIDAFGAISARSAVALKEFSSAIGFVVISGLDDAYFLPDVSTLNRLHLEIGRVMATGEAVRDFSITPDIVAIWPYGAASEISNIIRFLWMNRPGLEERKLFGVRVHDIDDFIWYQYREFYSSRQMTPLSIAFASVATHAHFSLDRNHILFNRHSPVIKLPEGLTEDDHLGLLAILNSSTACFWLKQVSHDKGSQGINEGFKSQEWERFYEFTATKLEKFPLPETLPTARGRELDTLAEELTACTPLALCEKEVPTRNRLEAVRAENERIRERMIASQEELDWAVYQRYGLITDAEAASLVASAEIVPELRLGERAFEIVMARRMAVGELATQWFARHRSKPITEIPAHWPDAYKQVVARRIEFIETDRNIGLIERPECKRRWQSVPWETKEREALTTWLLDRCEDKSLWFGPDAQPRPLTVNSLADKLRADPDFVSVARLLAGEDTDLADVLEDILATEHVPFLAQYRYKPAGLIKRAVWEHTWQLQREEDRDNKRLDIKVPPKYTSADFLKPSYWHHRGKLDVPKERFISYPAAGPDSDPSLLLGWAGWDHREQAYALITLITERSQTDGWGKDRVTPLIVGLAEIMPWVRQWHDVDDQGFGQTYAAAYDDFLTSQRLAYQLTDADLANVKPPKSPARRKSSKPGRFTPVVLSDE
jgi:hypothetical protein